MSIIKYIQSRKKEVLEFVTIILLITGFNFLDISSNYSGFLSLSIALFGYASIVYSFFLWLDRRNFQKEKLT